ncbi:unnamed protein product [Anisakis simplex]|uniref:RING-type domain-containing protein n=1 Tax=Anisakis simplex TaxID=6269 RepID=A0A0M3JR50_ANISI|nr:unnamed protein product [Anisakis simplex]
MCDNKSTSGSAVGCYNGSSMICSADSGLELDKSGIHPMIKSSLSQQRHYGTSPNFSCYSSRISPPRTSTSSGVGVRRATSFHNTTTSSTNRNSANYDDLTSAMPIHEMRYRFSPSQFQLQRLLDAFEKEQKSFGDESKRSIETLEEKCKQFADKQANLQTNLLDRENEIRSLKIQLSDYASVKEQLRKTENELNKQILEDKSKANQIRVLSEEAEMVKRQHELDIRQKEEVFLLHSLIINKPFIMITDYFFIIIDGLVKKLSLAEGENKPLVEKNAKLLLEIDVLKKQLATKQAELDKCSNYHDEILKAEQRIEQIRLERDEVRSTLSKVPTCVICLDKRMRFQPQMLYMPCSHFICCEVCGNRFDHCPTCRQKICGKITVYQ